MDLRLPEVSRDVHVMHPMESLAEKILGWTANGSAKHYADAAWAASRRDDRAEYFDSGQESSRRCSTTS